MRKPERGIFNYNHLYYFYVTFNCAKIADAAKELNVARAGLSKQLTHLQKQLGVTLFYSERGRKVLTPLGKEIHEMCEIIFHNEKDLRSKIDSGKSGEDLL